MKTSPVRFVLFKRPSGIYYAELFDGRGARIASKSTGKRKPGDAGVIADGWIKNGIPDSGTVRPMQEYIDAHRLKDLVDTVALTEADALDIVAALRKRGLLPLVDIDSGGEVFGDWLVAFWDHDTSEYIKDRLLHGHSATKRHCQDMQGRARTIKALLPEGLRIADVRKDHLTKLGLALGEKKLAGATIRKTMSACTTALAWAFGQGLTRFNVNADENKAMGFVGNGARRGLLEYAEAAALFSTSWSDERARVACLTAALTGARIGEILALRREDIGDDVLYIRHSYSIRDGLKAPKNGEGRIVPIDEDLRDELLRLEASSRHPAGPHRFVFHGRYLDAPIDQNRILAGFRRALVSMNGVEWDNEEARLEVLAEYRARRIDFHSWRHWNLTYMKSNGATIDDIAKASGHKTLAMAEHYADHATIEALERVRVASRRTFAGLLLGGKGKPEEAAREETGRA